MSNTSIGSDDPRNAPLSGIDDEVDEKMDGKKPGHDADHGVTAEDIESGNDRNVSADDLGRSGKTGKDPDDAIELGK